MRIKIIGLSCKCCWMLRVSGLHSNVSRYSVNVKIYKMCTDLLKYYMLILYIRLTIFETFLTVSHANASHHPKENYMIVCRGFLIMKPLFGSPWPVPW